MSQQVLILVSGAPGTGKTWLARELSRRFHIPLLQRDGLKENLFDSLGWSDREWSKKLGKACYRLLEYILREHLPSGLSYIIESNFNPKFDTEWLQQLQIKHRLKIIQIFCFCDKETRIERFIKRVKSGERHPGHVDPTDREQIMIHTEQWQRENMILPLEGELIELDTTGFAKASYDNVYKIIQGNI